MFVSFQQWPEFLTLLQQWEMTPNLPRVRANVIANFIADEKLDPQMFASYRLIVEEHFNSHTAAGSMELWCEAHQAYFLEEIRTQNSQAFRKDRMKEYFTPKKWLLQLRRANNISPKKLASIEKVIEETKEILELRGIDADQLDKVDQDLKKIKNAIALDITAARLESFYDDFFSNRQLKQNITTAIDALNIHAEYENRNGQPVFIGFVDDFPDVLELIHFSGSLRPKIKAGFERTAGTVIRDHLGISSYTKDDSVILFCYLSPDFTSQSNSKRLAAPTVLDTTASNEWFFPTPHQYGRLGHSVCINGQCPPCCELIHPQESQSPDTFVWAGKIGTFPSADIGRHRSDHALQILQNGHECIRSCRLSGHAAP